MSFIEEVRGIIEPLFYSLLISAFLFSPLIFLWLTFTKYKEKKSIRKIIWASLLIFCPLLVFLLLAIIYYIHLSGLISPIMVTFYILLIYAIILYHSVFLVFHRLGVMKGLKLIQKYLYYTLAWAIIIYCIIGIFVGRGLILATYSIKPPQEDQFPYPETSIFYPYLPPSLVQWEQVEEKKGYTVALWLEKEGDKPWNIVIALATIGRYDRRLAVSKTYYKWTRAGIIFPPIGEVEYITLKPNEVRLLRFAVTNEINIGIYQVKPEWYNLSDCFKIVPWQISDKRLEPIELGKEEKVLRALGNKFYWQPTKFIADAGEEVEIECYVTSGIWEKISGDVSLPLGIEIRKEPHLRLLDYGGAKLSEEEGKYILNYGVMPAKKVNKFKISLQMPNVKRISSKYIDIRYLQFNKEGRSSIGEDTIRILVRPRTSYQQRSIDKIISYIKTNLTCLQIFQMIGYLLATVTFLVLLCRLFQIRHQRKTS